MPRRRWTPDDISRILITPFYPMTCFPKGVNRTALPLSRIEWLLHNAALLSQMGTEAWLNTYVQNLQDGEFVLDHRISRALAIRIGPLFAEPHPLLSTEERWIRGNVQSIAEVGMIA